MFDYNKNVAERDIILFGDYEESKYWGGIRRFEDLSVEELEKLVERRFADPGDMQNYAPTIKLLLSFGKRHKLVTYGGYAVSLKRDDYRISIDSIKLVTPDIRDASDFIRFCKSADELNSYYDGDGITATMSAWWD